MNTSSIISYGSKILKAGKTYVAPMCEIKSAKQLGSGIEQLTQDMFVTRPQIIKPCCLGQSTPVLADGRLRLEYHKKIEKGEVEEIYDYIWHCFKNSVTPQFLKEQTIPVKKSLHLSNFDKLDGSLAISSKLDGTVLSTDGLYQCAGISIVDKKQDVQTLIHCYADQATVDVKKMLEYITKQSNHRDLNISIIPGCRATTSSTVAGINDLLKNICPQSKINYMNFPKRILRSGETAILLQNGELSFCNTNMIAEKLINPIEQVIYFS